MNKMSFTEFKERFLAHFTVVQEYADYLYEVDVDKDELWNLYLDSFPVDMNDIFRKRREMDCSCCRQFIRAFGNVVAIINGAVISVWDFRTDDIKYQPVLDALSKYIHSKPIVDVFYTDRRKIGTDYNYEYVDLEARIKWDHFFIELPEKFMPLRIRRHLSEGEYKGYYRETRNVFKRSLDEISIDAIDTVLELIHSNSLYRGAEWEPAVMEFKRHKKIYDQLTIDESKEIYAWFWTMKETGPAVSKIRNHSIGVLLTDISEGMDLESAVRRYEKIVAPQNYKRPKAIYTQKMLDAAQKTITDLGYMDALPRRHATISDISINNVLFCDRTVKAVQTGDIFADMAKNTTKKPLTFERIDEIQIDKFIENVLPTAESIEVYLENRFNKNLVSLIAPVNKDAQSMFKWNNNFGWAYSGNVTDSLKEDVKAAGGKVDGALRFSIRWNAGNVWNSDDFDAHCRIYANSNARVCRHIFYATPKDHATYGELDVDIRNPIQGKTAVENIVFPDKNLLIPGTYEFYVNNYQHRGGIDGFEAEIEFDGKTYQFSHERGLRHDETVRVASVLVDDKRNMEIHPWITPSMRSKELWHLNTNDFIPVTAMMYSPNYWDGQTGIGHKHVFFMLKGCLNPENPNGFYNEFLRNELMEHKRVFEALGSRMKVNQVPHIIPEEQLSGIGFSTTKRDYVIVRVTGATKRVIKVTF